MIAAQLGNFSFDQHVAALTILDQLVIRYRHEMRSDTLWTEIILVVNSVTRFLNAVSFLILLRLPSLLHYFTSECWSTQLVPFKARRIH